MLNDLFRRVAQKCAEALGWSSAFILAVLVVLAWAAAGPFFGYSDTWQLVINTGTTIVTFLMVFLIQNAQNRDAKAFHLKLDELIRGVKGARDTLINLQDLTDDELEQLRVEFQRIKERSRKIGVPKPLATPEAPREASRTKGLSDESDRAAEAATQRRRVPLPRSEETWRQGAKTSFGRDQ